jgi:ribosomal protein RSM22 (predicted rRNA methylase)
VVLLAYTLSDMPTDHARATAVALLWKAVSEGGVLVIIDRGNPEGSRLVRSARKLLLQQGAVRIGSWR